MGGGQPWAADGFILALFSNGFCSVFQKCCSSQWNSIDFEIAAVDSRGQPWTADGRGRWTAVDGRTAVDGGRPWTADGRGRWTAVDGGRRTAVDGGRPWTAGDAVVTADCCTQIYMVP